MPRNASWKDLLTDPKEHDHYVQLYRSEFSLVEAISLYIEKALARKEGVVIVSTPEHWEPAAQRLTSAGIDLAAAEKGGQLTREDAATLLSRFMIDDMPDWALFNDSVGALMARVERGAFTPVRAYGEMVNLLWLEGNISGAVRLEQFWNDLAKMHGFSLLCAYAMDSLDKSIYGGAAQDVCAQHTHVIPAEDYEAFDRAVGRALRDVVGYNHGVLALYQARRQHKVVMPEAQATVFWLKDHLPLLADRVLDLARRNYLEGSAVSA